jgi:hypothetical protein
MEAKGKWRWARGFDHFFLRYHPWSVCVGAHRSEVEELSTGKRCPKCSKLTK